MEILYKKEKEEADQLLEQQRLVSSKTLEWNQIHFVNFMDSSQFSAIMMLEGVDKLVVTSE